MCYAYGKVGLAARGLMFYVHWRFEQDLRIPQIFWCFCRWRRQYLAHRLIMLKILSQSGSFVVIALAGASLH